MQYYRKIYFLYHQHRDNFDIPVSCMNPSLNPWVVYSTMMAFPSLMWWVDVEVCNGIVVLFICLCVVLYHSSLWKWIALFHAHCHNYSQRINFYYVASGGYVESAELSWSAELIWKCAVNGWSDSADLVGDQQADLACWSGAAMADLQLADLYYSTTEANL